jgi:hypothetical protein
MDNRDYRDDFAPKLVAFWDEKAPKNDLEMIETAPIIERTDVVVSSNHSSYTKFPHSSIL